MAETHSLQGSMTAITVPNPLDLDDIFFQANVGRFGIYQFVLALMLQLFALGVTGLGLGLPAFASLKPTFICHRDDATSEVSICLPLANCSNSSVISQFHSFYLEWPEMCTKDYIPKMMITVMNLGLTVSLPISGYFADYWGRKWQAILATLFSQIFPIIAAFLTDWLPVAVLLFLSAVSAGMRSVPLSVLANELVTKRYRVFISIALSQWVITCCSIALIAYFTRAWRSYLIVFNVVCLPITGLACFWLVESPRWLMQQSQFGRAAECFARMAKLNLKLCPVDASVLRNFMASNNPLPLTPSMKMKKKMIEQRQQKKRGVFCCSLVVFRDRCLRKFTLVQMFGALMCAFLLSVIFYDVGSLAGSPFLNMALYGLSRIWCPFLMIWLDWTQPKFGRRPAVLIGFGFAVLCMTVNSSLIVFGLELKAKLVITLCSMISAVLIGSFVFTMILVLTVELFPTVIRNIANGWILVVSSLGFVLSPLVLYLKEFYHALPYLITAILCMFAFLLYFFLIPETKGQPLPESLFSFDNDKDDDDVDNE